MGPKTPKPLGFEINVLNIINLCFYKVCSIHH